ncbi:MAG TPA: hypothetical protein VKZ79_09705 [Alphaproteobacteria bacterium]|nr:hypothetical protein [Alphaproteobacteria bacterium]
MSRTYRSGLILRRLAAGVGGAAAIAALAISGPARADHPKNVCLWVNRIDHTRVLNDHQILFFETNGKIWQSNLPVPCRTMTSQDGFAWESGIPEICGNVEQIRVLRTGEHCLLGAFVPYVPGGANPVGTSAPKSERWLGANSEK